MNGRQVTGLVHAARNTINYNHPDHPTVLTPRCQRPLNARSYLAPTTQPVTCKKCIAKGLT